MTAVGASSDVPQISTTSATSAAGEAASTIDGSLGKLLGGLIGGLLIAIPSCSIAIRIHRTGRRKDSGVALGIQGRDESDAKPEVGADGVQPARLIVVHLTEVDSCESLGVSEI